MGQRLSRAICIVAGLFYPAYKSFKALESPGAQDDKQWLTYWVVYAFSTSFETASARLVSWLPGYYLTKTLVLLWMMMPKTKGAITMYTRVLHPLLKRYEPLVDRKLLEAQHAAHQCVQDFQQQGTEAITRRLAAVQTSELVQNVTHAIISPLTSPQFQNGLKKLQHSIERNLSKNQLQSKDTKKKPSSFGKAKAKATVSHEMKVIQDRDEEDATDGGGPVEELRETSEVAVLPPPVPTQ